MSSRAIVSAPLSSPSYSSSIFPVMAGTAVHALVLARLKSDFFHNLPEIGRHVNLLAGIAASPRFLRSDGHSFFNARGIVRSNLRSDAVFEGRDDFAARGVVL